MAITENEAASESVYYCAACRIANLLDVANKPVFDAVEREVNVRGKSHNKMPSIETAHESSLVVIVYDRCMVICGGWTA